MNAKVISCCAVVTVLTCVNFVVCFEVALLVETPATDGTAVRFLSCVGKFVPFEFIRVRKFFATH